MMSDSRRAHVDALFDAALTLPADARAAFLDAECKSDPASRTEVEELLRLATEPSHLLQPAALTAVKSSGCISSRQSWPLRGKASGA